MSFEKSGSGVAESGSKAERGFSLVEMLIAMVIFLIVIGSIYGMLLLGRVDRNRSSRRTDVLKNARSAIHLIGRDALNAGLGYHKKGAVVPDNFITAKLGIPADTDTERDRLTGIIAGNNLLTNNLLGTGGKTDIISFSYRDTDFNSGAIISLKNVKSASSTNPEIARLVTKKANEASVVNKYDLYLIESDSSQIAVMATERVDGNEFDISPIDPLGMNLPFNGTGTNSSLLVKCVAPTETSPGITENCTTYLASAKRFHWVSYKVKPDGTLVRIIYGNNVEKPFDEQIREQPLAYNVRNLQFKYVLEDGTVSDNPSAGPDGDAGTEDDTPYNMNLVRQISVTIEVQSTESDEMTGKFDIITLNATFSTRNLEYDAG